MTNGPHTELHRHISIITDSSVRQRRAVTMSVAGRVKVETTGGKGGSGPPRPECRMDPRGDCSHQHTAGVLERVGRRQARPPLRKEARRNDLGEQ